MLSSLNLYFFSFLNPSSTYKNEDDEKIGYFEVLGISWSLHFIYAFYSVFALYLGVASYEYLSQSKDFSHMLFESFNVSLQKFSLLFTLGEVILYPLLFQFAYKFWVYVLKFYAEIFDYEDKDQLETVVEDLLHTLFTANLFLMIPIFGNVLSFLTQGYYLFLGLRKKLNFTRLQAFLVLLTPLFLLFLTAILIASYMTLLVSLF
jgi:hypothetical protein